MPSWVETWAISWKGSSAEEGFLEISSGEEWVSLLQCGEWGGDDETESFPSDVER